MSVTEAATLLDLLRSGCGAVVTDGSRTDAADLWSLARRAAAGMSRRLERGDGALLIDDGGGVELLATMFGAWAAGVRVAVVSGSSAAAEVSAAVAQTGSRLTVLGSPSDAPDDAVTTFDDLLSGSAEWGGREECAPGDVAIDIVSSGTTGPPKCVSYTHAALLSNVRAQADRLALGSGDTLYSPLPLSLGGVVGMVLLPALYAGSTAVLGRLHGARVTRAPQQLRAVDPTLLYGVPYTFELLTRQRRQWDATRLRWAICSSAPLPENTFDRVWAHLGTPPRSSYCLAEAAVVTLNTSNDIDQLRHTVGTPLDGVRVRVDEQAGSNGTGPLVIGGAGCGVGYRHGGHVEPFPGGEVRTRDVGVLRDGILTLVGRMDDVIQVAGHNVDLAHVQRVVGRCPGVGVFAVVVDHHERLGRVPVLLAEASSLTVAPRDVIEFCRRELQDFEVPRQVRVVDRIPRTISGKVRLSVGDT